METTITKSERPVKGPLSPAEFERLAQLEPIIQRGLANFVEVGTALLEISDRRLYRATHSTFKDYVQATWKMSVRQAYRLCESAEVINSLPAECDQLVTTESQARELAKVPVEDRVAVLQHAALNGGLTAESIRVAADREVILKAASAIRNEEQSQRREAKIAQISARGLAPLTGPATYRVIYADPPWTYECDVGTGCPMKHSVRDHYPTMTTDEICALQVPQIAEPDSVLFLWVTMPQLPHGLRVMEAWGFEYKTNLVWDKQGHVPGYYTSDRHEHLLLGRRGSCTPDGKKAFDRVISIPKSRHSEKPKEFRDLIDSMYPHGRRIEMFCRGTPGPGWAAWGNEANADTVTPLEEPESPATPEEVAA